MDSIMKEILRGEYTVDSKALPHTDSPSYTSVLESLRKEEQEKLLALRRRLFERFGVGGKRAELAFEIALAHESQYGLMLVVQLFQNMLPLVRG